MLREWLITALWALLVIIAALIIFTILYNLLIITCVRITP